MQLLRTIQIWYLNYDVGNDLHRVNCSAKIQSRFSFLRNPGGLGKDQGGRGDLSEVRRIRRLKIKCLIKTLI